MRLSRLIIVALGLMASQAALHIVRPMTSYRLLALGEGSTSVGLVSAAFALAPLFLAVPLSRLASGRRTGQVALVGSVLMVLGCLGLALMRSVAEAIASSVVLGLGHIGIMLAFQVLIARESPDKDYDRNFGYFTAGASVGQLVGPLLGTALLTSAGSTLDGTTLAMLMASGATALVVGLCIPLVRPEGSAPESSADVPVGSMRSVLRAPGALAAIYVGLVVLSAIDVLSAYLPVLGEETGISPLIVGTLLSVRAGASIASRLLIGPVVGWRSRISVLVASSAVAAAGISVLPATANVPLLLGLMVVLGIALGFGQPLTMSWLVLLVPSDVRGHALAVRLTGNRLGQVVAPSAAGALSGVAGTASVFWMMGGLLASASLVGERFRRRTNRTAGPDD